MRRILVAIPLMAAAGLVAAQEADRRVTKALDRARIAHEVDDQGDVRVSFLTGEGRSQMVLVRSATSAFGTLDTRELVSAAYRSPTMALPSEVANRLLELSARARLGGWTRQGPMALLVTRIPAEADPKELADAIEYTARAADAAERELNGGKDEY